MCVKAGTSLFFRRGNKLSKTKKGGQIKTSISQCGGVIHSGANKGSSFFCPYARSMLYDTRSDLKNPNHFNFSSFFGDFCL